MEQTPLDHIQLKLHFVKSVSPSVNDQMSYCIKKCVVFLLKDFQRGSHFQFQGGGITTNKESSLRRPYFLLLFPPNLAMAPSDDL